MNKYEMDIDEKQRELDGLKADRARDLSRLQGVMLRDACSIMATM